MVKDLDGFEIICPVAASEWVVGVVWREVYVFGVDGILGVFFEGSVGFLESDDGEERLARLSLFPVSAVKRIFDIEVEVSFAGLVASAISAVGSKVSCIAEVFGYDFYWFGQCVVVEAMTSVVMCTDGGLVHCGHESRAAW